MAAAAAKGKPLGELTSGGRALRSETRLYFRVSDLRKGNLVNPPQANPVNQLVESVARSAIETGTLGRVDALRLLEASRQSSGLEALTEAAFESKTQGKGDVITVSRNVFLPLTNLCR